MQPSVKIIALLCSLFFFYVFFMLIKRKSMNPFYTCLWFFIGCVMVSVVVFEKFYKSLATFMGVHDASFLFLIGVIFFLLMYVLHLSIKFSEVPNRIQALISRVAILEKRLDRYEKRQ